MSELFKELLQSLNILFIPAVIFLIKLEHRITKMETTLDIHCKDDKVNEND
jgi:hypothetical protein